MNKPFAPGKGRLAGLATGGGGEAEPAGEPDPDRLPTPALLRLRTGSGKDCSGAGTVFVGFGGKAERDGTGATLRAAGGGEPAGEGGLRASCFGRGAIMTDRFVVTTLIGAFLGTVISTRGRLVPVPLAANLASPPAPTPAPAAPLLAPNMPTGASAVVFRSLAASFGRA